MHFYVGEALVGIGNEEAHIDLMIGSKEGPVGVAFANALSTQSEGHTNLLAVLEPNVAAKPSTVMITKVTHQGNEASGPDVWPSASSRGQSGCQRCW